MLTGRLHPLRLLGVNTRMDPWPHLHLGSERLLLRPPGVADFGVWQQLRRESRAFLEPWEPIWPDNDLTLPAFKRRIRQYDLDIETDEAYPFLIFSRQKSELLGGITLGHIRRGAAQAGTLGYWMGESHAGKGIMGEAVRLICNFAFQRLMLCRIEAACLPENHRSIRLLNSCDFQQEGLARRYLNIAGIRRDHLLFALSAGQ